MADTKLTALTETTSPATSDDVYVVTTPGGTPASKRCTIANLKTAMGVKTVATDTIWDAAGDLAVGTGADTAAKLTKGADGTVLQMASGAVGWQYPTLTYATAALTGNVTLTTGGTLYDGPSISLAAGTWLITGIAHLVDGSPYTAMAAELWDGTNHLAAGSVHSGTDYGSIALSCIAVFGAPVTVKIRATSVHNGGVMYASQQQAGTTGTNNATIISAIRIA